MFTISHYENSKLITNGIEIKDICKNYPGVQALSNISLEINWGTILGLAGENGSGKSTLLKIITGMETVDSGEVRVDGRLISGIKAGLHSRISMVTQEPSLVESLSIAENIAMGRFLGNKFIMNWNSVQEIALKCIERLGAQIDLNTKVSSLPPDQQQIISIARSLASDPKILLLDEATSSLTDDQTERLFQLLVELKNQGKIIIFISHKLKEYIKICDRITVLRDSNYICNMEVPGINEQDVINAMVGRELTKLFPPRISSTNQNVAIKLDELNSKNIKNISFTVNKGEIFVLSGLVGCGRSEVLRSLYGALPYSGRIELNGKEINIRSSREAIKAGIAYIPAERKSEGIIGGLSVLENGILGLRLRNPIWSWIKQSQEREAVQQMVKDFHIKTPSLETAIETLSGGNQQKVILARSIVTNPMILLLDEPTRGIDVGAKAEIYHLLRKITEKGVTIIVSSSDLQEVIGLADRVGVMFRGHLQKILNEPNFTEEKVMYYATGNG